MHKYNLCQELQYHGRQIALSRKLLMKPMVAGPVPLRDTSAEEQYKDARAAALGAAVYFSGPVGFSLFVLWFAFAGLLPWGAVSAADQPAAKTQQQTTSQQTVNHEPLAAKRIPNTVCQAEPGQGPEMVIMPPGSFEMGDDSSDQDDEKPSHKVTLDYAFALSRCEVTVANFRSFVESTDEDMTVKSGNGCWILDRASTEVKQDSTIFWNRQGFEGVDTEEQHPAVCISWEDALMYVTWLNDQVGIDGEFAYRLPTESEFEYALRGGNPHSIPWGDESQCQYSNAADQSMPSWFKSEFPIADCSDGFPWVAEVGSLLPNSFGLFDMSGNVWEWTQDCWNDSYDGAPENGTSWDGSEFPYDNTKREACNRVLRGGSWGVHPPFLRSAIRFQNASDYRSVNVGFRLARTLGPSRPDAQSF